MDKLEVGMYVKTELYNISRILDTEEDNEWLELDKNKGYLIHKDTILKASHNIIDLIKHKDIILGKDGKLYQCWKVYKDYVFTYSKNKQGQTITLVDYQIDKVLCYEQFESMSYRIGD